MFSQTLKLMKKDLLVNKRTLLSYTGIAALMVLLFSRAEMGLTFLSTWSFMIPYMYSTVNSQQEEVNKGLLFLRSLPVSPMAIAWSKFLVNLLITVASALFMYGIAKALLSLGWLVVEPGDMTHLWLNVSAAWPLIFILQGLHLLLFFAMDYRRATTLTMMLPLLFLLPVAFPSSVKGFRNWISLHLPSLIAAGPFPIFMVALLIGLILDMILVFIAGRVLARREL